MKITNDTGYLSPTVKTNWDSTAKNAISKVADKMLKTDMKPSFSMIVKGSLTLNEAPLCAHPLCARQEFVTQNLFRKSVIAMDAAMFIKMKAEV
ncbi:hypothetical protein RRG08_018475 [Elysia crispata]|uniref:Uncharacterized protein n=1 Tax=Elysia crispata TaxID=231223 RepID=A0AAE0YTE4_9GAST|nr:hypothetical protein RRG08_018475 [Elysia crispata]